MAAQLDRADGEHCCDAVGEVAREGLHERRVVEPKRSRPHRFWATAVSSVTPSVLGSRWLQI